MASNQSDRKPEPGVLSKAESLKARLSELEKLLRARTGTLLSDHPLVKEYHRYRKEKKAEMAERV